jgi:hypothetical protein
MKTVVFALFVLALAGCSNSGQKQSDSEPIKGTIDHSIDFHFEDKNPSFSFVFRNRNYSVDYSPGGFEYVCTYSDTVGSFRRVLNNSGYFEYLDGELLDLSEKDSLSHSESVNSVSYFNLLPLVLKDSAVQTEELGLEEIESKTYHKIEVTFAQEGGGSDFQDVYYYWFDTLDYSMDYLAYSFVVNGGGTRFRKAENFRKVNGIGVQDYLNFKGPTSPDSLKYISDLYKSNKLPLLSEIRVSRIKVNR